MFYSDLLDNKIDSSLMILIGLRFLLDGLSKYLDSHDLLIGEKGGEGSQQEDDGVGDDDLDATLSKKTFNIQNTSISFKFEKCKSTFLNKVESIHNEARVILGDKSKNPTNYTESDFKTINESADVLHGVNPDNASFLLIIFPHEDEVEKLGEYFHDLILFINKSIKTCSDKVKKTLLEDESMYAYKIARSEIECIIKLRSSSIIQTSTEAAFDKLVEVVTSYTRNLKEELNNIINSFANDSWFIDTKNFIRKLDKLKSAEILKNINGHTEMYNNDYDDINNKLRVVFLQILDNIQQNNLHYTQPEFLQKFVQPMQVLVEFASLFRHKIKVKSMASAPGVSNDALAKIEERKRSKTNISGLLMSADDGSWGFKKCVTCNNVTWGILYRFKCGVCSLRVHNKAKCGDKIQLKPDSNTLTLVCKQCITYRQSAKDLGVEEERLSLVLEPSLAENMTNAFLKGLTPEDEEKIRESDAKFYEPMEEEDKAAAEAVTQAPVSSLAQKDSPATRPASKSLLAKFMPTFISKKPSSLPATSSTLSSSVFSTNRRSLAETSSKTSFIIRKDKVDLDSIGDKGTEDEDIVTKSKAYSFAPTSSFEEQDVVIDFNAATTMDFEAKQINELSSIADIANRIILEFRMKVKGQLLIAKESYPEPETFDSSYRFDHHDVWASIQFAKNSYNFKFKEIYEMEKAVLAFSDFHFQLLNKALNDWFEIASSETVNNAKMKKNKNYRSDAVKEMSDLFSYLTYAIEYHRRHHMLTDGSTGHGSLSPSSLSSLKSDGDNNTTPLVTSIDEDDDDDDQDIIEGAMIVSSSRVVNEEEGADAPALTLTLSPSSSSSSSSATKNPLGSFSSMTLSSVSSSMRLMNKTLNDNNNNIDDSHDLHQVLFLKHTTQIIDRWITNDRSLLKLHIKKLQEKISSDDCDITKLNMLLMAVKPLSILDLWLFPPTESASSLPTVSVGIKYSDIYLDIENNIAHEEKTNEFNIENERFKQVYDSYGHLNESEILIHKDIFKLLSVKIAALLETANENVSKLVISVSNISLWDTLSKNLKSLNNAVKYVGSYLNEPLRSSLKQQVEDIEVKLLQTTMIFLNQVDPKIKQLDFAFVEEVFQVTKQVLITFFGSVDDFYEYARHKNLEAKHKIKISIPDKMKTLEDKIQSLFQDVSVAFDNAIEQQNVSSSSMNLDEKTDQTFENAFGSSIGKAFKSIKAGGGVLMSTARTKGTSGSDHMENSTGKFEILGEVLSTVMPRRIIESLKTASNVGNSNYYLSHMESFNVYLDCKFVELVSMSKDTKYPTDIREKIIHVGENSVPLLPEQLGSKIRSELSSCSSLLRREVEIFRKTMIDNEDLSDIKVLVLRFREYYQTQFFQNSYEVQLLISKKIKVMAEKYSNHLNKCMTTSIFQSAKLSLLSSASSSTSKNKKKNKNKMTKDEHLVLVLNELPLVWDHWVSYFRICSRISKDKNYSRQIRYINRSHDINDDEGISIVVDLMGNLAYILEEILVKLTAIKITDKNAFQIFHQYFENLILFIGIETKSKMMFTQLESSSNELSNLSTKLWSMIEKLSSCFKHYSTCIQTTIKKELTWPRTVSQYFDVIQANDKLLDHFTSFLLSYTPTSSSPSQAKKILEIKDNMSEVSNYQQTKQNIIEILLKNSQKCSVGFLHNDKLNTNNAADRDVFYQEYLVYYTPLIHCDSLKHHYDDKLFNLTKLKETTKKSLTDELDKIKDRNIELIVTCIPSSNPNDYNEFNIWYDNLRSFRDISKKDGAAGTVITQYTIGLMKTISQELHAQIDKMKKQAEFENDNYKLIMILAQLKDIAVAIASFKKIIDEKIDIILLGLKNSDVGLQRVIDVSLLLTAKSGDAEYGPLYQMILADHSAFKGLKLSIFNNRIAQFTIDHALDEQDGIKGDILNKIKLRHHYEIFIDEYRSFVNDNLSNPAQGLEQIKSKVKTLSREGLKRSCINEARDALIRNLMVNLFAFWTLSNCQYYTDMTSLDKKKEDGEGDDGDDDDDDGSVPVTSDGDGDTKKTNGDGDSGGVTDKRNYLLQPHAGQILSLFRIFGLDTHNSKMDNHLIQIGTGEGKSIILAISAAVLSLLGYSVHCACYSSYLSKRDYEAFSDLFINFEINQFINYGTFNELCELFIEDICEGGIRNSVESLILGSSSKVKKNKKSGKINTSRPKILLIDEVDVFFSKDFYGNTYRPLAKLVDPVITSLIDMLWAKRNDRSLNFFKIKNSSEFQKLIKKFPVYEKVLEETVKTMLYDMKDLDEHSKLYQVIEDQIGYKDQDQISFDISYGYKTLFSYYKENENGKISPSTLNDKKYIIIDCGEISYAEVPKMYECRLGVSGTLSTLSPFQKDLLVDEYNIKKYTFTPSVYPQGTRDYAPDKDITIEKQVGHFNFLTNEINARSQVNQSSLKRPILVFFESTQILMDYYNSPAGASLKHKIKCVTESVSSEDKESIIRQATSPGSVTILSREFGRGTDFIIYDDNVSTCGGVHVIQTFLSEEKSEEVQIMGRAARQGCKGSYSMILSSKNLEKFQIPETGDEGSVAAMKKSGKYIDRLDKQRNSTQGQEWSGIKISVREMLKSHKETLNFLSLLRNTPSSLTIPEYLLNRNKSCYVEEATPSRTIILMDATGSMSSLLTNAKNTVKTMFSRAYAVIEQDKQGAIFDVQFVVYRNYNSPIEKLLEYSAWENKPDNLYKFMDNISASGGWGCEAAECGLWHVNEEIRKHPDQVASKVVSQVILIGDMPPNTKDEVTKKRENKGESYWKETQFKKPTYYEDELKQLVDNKVKIHTFYLRNAAQETFQEMATKSGGECSYLDMSTNIDKAADILTDLVTTKILVDLGGASDGAKMVETYKQMFGYVK